MALKKGMEAPVEPKIKRGKPKKGPVIVERRIIGPTERFAKNGHE